MIHERPMQPPAWRLHLDLAITRRKLYHVITNPEGEVVFESRFVSECIAWFANDGIDAYILSPSTKRTLGLAVGEFEIRRP